MAGSEWRNIVMGRQQNASCSWGGNRRRRVHGEATECVVFMGRQQNASCSWGGNEMRRLHREATECVVFIGRQRNAWEPTGWVGTECVVVFIRRALTEQAMETRPGVPQNGGNGPPTVETGVLLIGRGVVYRKMGLHGILFISTIDLLQPPRAPVHPASTARYSTVYCSTTPPLSTVHPALHTTGSCSTTPPRAPLHRLLSI